MCVCVCVCVCESIVLPSVDILMIGFVSGNNPRAELCLFMLTSRRIYVYICIYIYICKCMKYISVCVCKYPSIYPSIYLGLTLDDTSSLSG